MSKEEAMSSAKARYIATHDTSLDWEHQIGTPNYKSPVQLLEDAVLPRTTDFFNDWIEYRFSCGKHADPFASYYRKKELENGEVIEEEVEIDLYDYIDVVEIENTIEYLILTTTRIQDLIYKCWAQDGSTEQLFEDICEQLQNGTALDDHLETYFDAVKKAGV